MQTKQYEQAIADYTQALGLSETYANVYLLKDNDSFSESFQNLSLQEAFDFKTYIDRGQAYLNLERYESAITDFTSAIAINPDTTWGYVPRAAVHQQLGKYQEAIADYSRIIELNQNRQELSNAEQAKPYKQRALIYVDSQDYDSAVEDLTQALEMNPNDPELLQLLALIYVRLQQDSTMKKPVVLSALGLLATGLAAA